jgi:hypothetical protein
MRSVINRFYFYMHDFLRLFINRVRIKFFKNLMRTLFILLMIGFLLITTSAVACLGRAHEYSIVFREMPVPRPKADVVIKAVLERTWSNFFDKSTFASVRITQVFLAPSGKIRPGERVVMNYVTTSCGPKNQVGDKGIIIAKLSVNFWGKIILHPYTHNIKGNITQPVP